MKPMCSMISAALLVGTTAVPGAGESVVNVSPSCAAPEYRQFDFWIGEWEVSDKGKPSGANRIERILDGCGLLETWRGASGYRGNSLNFYDASRKRWHQTWVDTTGLALSLEGEFANGSMVLAGKHNDPKQQHEVHDRITWTPNPDGTVRQLWETSADGESWSAIFDGLYSPKR